MPAAGQRKKMAPSPTRNAFCNGTNKAVDPPGDCSQRDLVHVPSRPSAEGKSCARAAPRECAAQRSHMGLQTHGPKGEPEAEEVLREINGWKLEDRNQLKSYNDLKPDGSTACGCWIYCGVHPETRS